LFENIVRLTISIFVLLQINVITRFLLENVLLCSNSNHTVFEYSDVSNIIRTNFFIERAARERSG
jgi:hypothetical protein